LIVTSPEREPAREAVFLAERLAARGMSRGGLVINRVHGHGLDGRSAQEVKALLAPELGERLAARVAANLADYDLLVERDRQTIARLSRQVAEGNPILVPHLDRDVEDLAALSLLADYLFA
jgi:hypothetical protein